MAAQNRLNWRALGLPVYLALALLVVVAAILLAAILSFQPAPGENEAPASADDYRARAEALLANAHPEDAEAALEKYGCVVCHREGAANGVAPSWVGIAERAATRRPPLTAAAYIYESITHPSAFIVPGYNDLMPKDFGTRLSDQELGDIIAYLLTPDAK